MTLKARTLEGCNDCLRGLQRAPQAYEGLVKNAGESPFAAI